MRGNSMNPIVERCLTFKWSKTFNSDTNTQVTELSKKLRENNINFCVYNDETDKYYPVEFTIRRSGKQWIDIIKIINEVRAAKYNYEKRSFYFDDTGKMQELYYCLN
jgi:hypothetical protein